MNVQRAIKHVTVLLHFLLEVLRDGGPGETPGVRGEVAGQISHHLEGRNDDYRLRYDVTDPESVLGRRGHDALGCLGGEVLQLPHLGGSHRIQLEVGK